MRRIFSTMLVLVLAIILVACGNDTGNDKRDVLVVGMEADYPPFNWMETKANDYNYPLHGMSGSFVAGYDVEMARLIAAELDMDLQIRMIAWDALIPALNSGQIDLIVAGMTPTAIRRESIDFTEQYYTVENVIVGLAAGSLANINSLEDLSGFKGIGQLGTVYAEIVSLIAANYEAKALNSLDSAPATVNAVLTGVADFTVLERPVAMQAIAANPELAIVLSPEGNPFNLTDDDLILSIGVKKGRETFLDSVNKALQTISQAQRTEFMDQASLRSNEE